MAWSKVLSFAEPFSYQTAIRGAELEVIPTARGEFRSELTQICLDQVWMQRARENLPRIYTGTTTRDRRVIGFLTDKNHPPIKHCGKEVVAGDIIVNDGAGMHRQTKSYCNWGSMSLALDDFNVACKAIVGSQLPPVLSTYVVRPSPVLMSRLLSAHERIGLLARTHPDVLASPEVSRHLDQELTHLMVMCVTEGAPSKMTAGVRRRDRIVARLEEFLEANPGRAIYLTEICAALGVPERTLRSACEAQIGMGPIRYLKLRRMHNVRRALLRSDPSETSVTQIATDQGFWELGHFSVSYRAMFGETPSESLKRCENQQPKNRKLPDRVLSLAGS